MLDSIALRSPSRRLILSRFLRFSIYSSARRGKLFVFGETLLDKGTGNKTWKERGVGDIKFLKHKESQRIRVLMRQEKTMKVIVNHFLDPRIVLVPNSGNDKSWVWVAFDFSEGELVETVSNPDRASLPASSLRLSLSVSRCPSLCWFIW